MTTREKSASEGQIRDAVERCANAMRGKDVTGVLSFYAPDFLLFDPPRRSPIAALTPIERASGSGSPRHRVRRPPGAYFGPDP
jgi:ketosteroid isomerase-like protein